MAANGMKENTRVELTDELKTTFKDLGVSELSLKNCFGLANDVSDLVLRLFSQGEYLQRGKIRLSGKRHEREGEESAKPCRRVWKH